MKKALLCMAALAAGMSLMAENVYTKVTTAPADWSGTYLIVCESEKVVFNGAANEENIDAKGGAAIIPDVTITDNIILGTPMLDAATFTIMPSEDELWQWAIQSASGLYIGHKDTADNGLSTELEIKGKCKHTLALEDGNLIATPKWEKSGAAYTLQYNEAADQLRFRYFKAGKKLAVQLYVQESKPMGVRVAERESSAVKVFENGQLLILKNGQRYSAVGAML